MRKILKRIGICALVATILWSVEIVKDKQNLQKNLIRLHIVAASDSQEDQALKLQVRDAVVKSLQENMKNLNDTAQAKEYLQNNLSEIELLANRVLQENGCADKTVASLKKESFSTRYYDTFTLPAGVYEALRITIGEGNGHNWWCVVFPALCLGTTVAEFEETAYCAGMSDSLTGTLIGEKNYEVRFLIMDTLGELENFLHKG